MVKNENGFQYMYHCKSTGQRPQVPNTIAKTRFVIEGLLHMGRPCGSLPHSRPSATDMRELPPPSFAALLKKQTLAGSTSQSCLLLPALLLQKPLILPGEVLLRPSVHLSMVMSTLPRLTLPIGLTRRKPLSSFCIPGPGRNPKQPPYVGATPL